MIGKVARYNSRFLKKITKNAAKERQHRRESDIAGERKGENERTGYYDPRGEKEFLELENHIRDFQSSLHPTYKDYVRAVRFAPTGVHTQHAYNARNDEDRDGASAVDAYEIDATLYSAHIISAG